MKQVSLFFLAILWLNCSPGKEPRTNLSILITSSEIVQVDNKSIPVSQLITELDELGVSKETIVTLSATPDITMEAIHNIQSLLIAQNITKISFVSTASEHGG